MFTPLLYKKLAVAVIAIAFFASPLDLFARSDSVVVKLSEYKLPVAVKGSTIGESGNAIIIAGGLDKKGVPVETITIVSDKGIVATAKLPIPLAHASVVSVNDAIYLVGGFDGKSVSDKVFRLEFKDNQLLINNLPDLNQPRCFAGVAELNGFLYVVGGITDFTDKKTTDNVVKINLKESKQGWTTLKSLPSGARIKPTVIGFYDGLHVFGGMKFDGAQATPVSDCWCYREKPIDGTTERGWKQLADLPQSLAASGAYSSGQSHVVIVGGVSEKTHITLSSAISEDSASDAIYIYHSVTDTWITGGTLIEPMISASFLKQKNLLTKKDMLTLAEPGNSALYSVDIKRAVKSLQFGDYAIMVIYFIFMAGIGIYFARKQNSSDEFALGNRKVKWWAAGVSMFATGASSISFMAIPAMAFQTNLVWFFPILLWLPLIFVQGYFIFPLLRKLKITSTYEYLEKRYSPLLRYVASGQCVIFQLLGRMSVVMLLPAIAISAVTGLNVFYSVAIMGFLTTAYTAIGGFEAVIWTDFIQGGLMLLGAIFMIVLAITGLPGGFSEFVSSASASGKFDMVILNWEYTMPVIWIFALGTMLQNLAFVADQPVIQRVYATPQKDMQKLAAMFILCGIIISLFVNFAGISIFTYFKANPEMLDPTMKNDQVMPLYVIQRLPTGIAGLIIAALFAASMSTLSSSMNSTATIISEDFYRKFFKNATDENRLKVMKWGSLVVGVIGTCMALFMASLEIKSMFKTWNIMMALLGGGFIGIYILGIFTRRANTIGACIGAAASIVCTVLVKELTPLHWVFFTPVAVLSCILVGYFTSLIIPCKKNKLDGLTIYNLIKEDESKSDDIAKVSKSARQGV